MILALFHLALGMGIGMIFYGVYYLYPKKKDVKGD